MSNTALVTFILDRGIKCILLLSARGSCEVFLIKAVLTCSADVLNKRVWERKSLKLELKD